MTDSNPYYVHCNTCDWSVIVEEGAMLKSTPPEHSAKSRAAAHSANGCPYDDIEIEEAERP